MIVVLDVCYFPELESDRYTQVVWLDVLEITEALFDAAIIILDNDMNVIKNVCTTACLKNILVSDIDRFFISRVTKSFDEDDIAKRLNSFSPSDFYRDPDIYRSKLHRLPDHNLTIRRLSCRN